MIKERVIRFLSHARYITLGMMDGGLAALSIVTAAYFTSITDAITIFRVLMGAGIGIAASNFSGAYLAETAEVNKERRKLERAMGLKTGHLQYTLVGYKLRKTVLVRAFTNSGAAFLGIILTAMPLLFLPYPASVAASILSAMGLLFILGVYLGHYNSDSLLASGLKVLLISLAVFAVNLLLSFA